MRTGIRTRNPSSPRCSRCGPISSWSRWGCRCGDRRRVRPIWPPTAPPEPVPTPPRNGLAWPEATLESLAHRNDGASCRQGAMPLSLLRSCAAAVRRAAAIIRSGRWPAYPVQPIYLTGPVCPARQARVGTGAQRETTSMAHRCRSNSNDGPSMSFRAGLRARGTGAGGSCGPKEVGEAPEAGVSVHHA